MVNVIDFKGVTDIEQINNAIAKRGKDGMVVIPPREGEDGRDYWLIDSAILLPENTTIVLRNCKIKLSDCCRDNFFRTANCGFGFPYPEKISNVHIKGEGVCVLEGADHPRATGDSEKVLACPCPHLPEDICRYGTWVPNERRESGNLEFMDFHSHSYGTDAGKEGESQSGDWRGIGILFANVEHFSIENVTIVKSHGWSISLEACAYGSVEKIRFEACMSKEIDGMLQNMENQDGLDLRCGCHDILISDITGQTGDDVVALTAIASKNFKEGGSLCSTQVMHNDWSKRESAIYNITIRNIRAHSHLCHCLRLYACMTKMWNIVVDGLIDTSPEGHFHWSAINIGELDTAYGECYEDSVSNVTISNVISGADTCIVVAGYLKNSVITNVIHRKNGNYPVKVIREKGLNNVQISNCICV